jgi:hypothetical protein
MNGQSKMESEHNRPTMPKSWLANSKALLIFACIIVAVCVPLGVVSYDTAMRYTMFGGFTPDDIGSVPLSEREGARGASFVLLGSSALAFVGCAYLCFRYGLWRARKQPRNRPPTTHD